MSKKAIFYDKATAESYWTPKNKWFKYTFYVGFIPEKGSKPFATIFVPSTDGKRTLEIDQAVKSRLSHAGFDVGYYTVTYCPTPEDEKI